MTVLQFWLSGDQINCEPLGLMLRNVRRGEGELNQELLGPPMLTLLTLLQSTEVHSFTLRCVYLDAAAAAASSYQTMDGEKKHQRV